ncbi:MAG: hypothetical protein V1743_07395 [Nanoarchaeota archaeon]
MRHVTLPAILVSSALLFSGCAGGPAAQHPDAGVSATFDMRTAYTPIEWQFGDDNKYGGYTGSRIQHLEDLVYTDRDPRSIQLTEWELPILAKLVPIKRLIETYANRFGIDSVWATMFFTYESQLIPADHNTFSDDYGLGQIKKESEKLALRLGRNTTSTYFTPDLNPEKSIFDPQKNIIMALLLHRYNIEQYGLKNSDQAYAVYVRGMAGLNSDGSLNDLTRDILAGFRARYGDYANIIPLFRLAPAAVDSLADLDTKMLLQTYHAGGPPEKMYAEELEYFLGALERKLDGSARSVLTYEICGSFAMTLDDSYCRNELPAYQRLARIEKQLNKLVQHPDLKERVKGTSNLLRSKPVNN